MTNKKKYHYMGGGGQVLMLNTLIIYNVSRVPTYGSV